jgi:DNA-binding MarR family transcriptional regulator
MPQPDAVTDDQLDLTLAAFLTGLALNEEVERRLRARGFPAVRLSQGFVIQHLLAGPLPIGELARRLQMTQQGASKAAAELVDAGLAERTPDPDDARVRRVGLSEHGRAAVEAARRVRAELQAQLAQTLGAERIEQARRLLLDALGAVGGIGNVRARRVPPLR